MYAAYSGGNSSVSKNPIEYDRTNGTAAYPNPVKNFFTEIHGSKANLYPPSDIPIVFT